MGDHSAAVYPLLLLAGVWPQEQGYAGQTFIYVCVMVCIWFSLRIFYWINESKTTSTTMSLRGFHSLITIYLLYKKIASSFYIVCYFVSSVKEQEKFLFSLKFISSSMLKNVVYSFIYKTWCHGLSIFFIEQIFWSWTLFFYETGSEDFVKLW